MVSVKFLNRNEKWNKKWNKLNLKQKVEMTRVVQKQHASALVALIFMVGMWLSYLAVGVCVYAEITYFILVPLIAVFVLLSLSIKFANISAFYDNETKKLYKEYTKEDL